jgi:hypothetical protein
MPRGTSALQSSLGCGAEGYIVFWVIVVFLIVLFGFMWSMSAGKL